MSWLGAVFFLKLRLRVTRNAERLARGQLAELHFWKFRKVFTYQSKQPKLSQVLLSFPWSTRKKFRPHFEKVLKVCPLAEKRGSLEGVRERGFKKVYFLFVIFRKRNKDISDEI
jgi:hypothetical protein